MQPVGGRGAREGGLHSKGTLGRQKSERMGGRAHQVFQSWLKVRKGQTTCSTEEEGAIGPRWHAGIEVLERGGRSILLASIALGPGKNISGE